MRRTVVRGVGGAAFAAALTLGLAGAAQADDEPLSIDDLPSISDAEVDVLRTAKGGAGEGGCVAPLRL